MIALPCHHCAEDSRQGKTDGLHSKQTMDDQNDARDGGRRQGRGDNGSAPQAIPDDEPALDGYAR